jgi:hypothetical protein
MAACRFFLLPVRIRDDRPFSSPCLATTMVRDRLDQIFLYILPSDILV